MLKISIGKIFGGYCGDKEETTGMMMEYENENICLVFNERDSVLPFMGGCLHLKDDIELLRDFLNKILEDDKNG
jgi:hypothetical protein